MSDGGDALLLLSEVPPLAWVVTIVLPLLAIVVFKYLVQEQDLDARPRPRPRASSKPAATTTTTAAAVERPVVPFTPAPPSGGHKLMPASFRKRSEAFDCVGEAIAASTGTQAEAIVAERVPGMDARVGCWVRNCLSPDECRAIIIAAEAHGFEQRQFEGSDRDSASSCACSDKLASAIFERLQPYVAERTTFDGGSALLLCDAARALAHLDSLPRNAPARLRNANANATPSTTLHWGTLAGCNVSVRVERYQPGQHLKLHRDGCVIVPGTTDTYTVFAVLVYLNEEYACGATRFAIDHATQPAPTDDEQAHDNDDENTLPRELYRFLDLRGQAGDALVFRHEFLHTGGLVEDAIKYVLRLDLAYRYQREAPQQSTATTAATVDS